PAAGSPAGSHAPGPARRPPRSASPRRRRSGAAWCRSRPGCGPGRGLRARPPALFFRGAGRGLVRAHDGAVDAEQRPVDGALAHLPGLEAEEDALPEAVAGPVAEAVVDGLPGAELGRQVPPAAAVGQGPEDAVEHRAVVLPRAAALAVGRQE